MPTTQYTTQIHVDPDTGDSILEIPDAICAELNIVPGDRLDIDAHDNNGTITLKPVPRVSISYITLDLELHQHTAKSAQRLFNTPYTPNLPIHKLIGHPASTTYPIFAPKDNNKPYYRIIGRDGETRPLTIADAISWWLNTIDGVQSDECVAEENEIVRVYAFTKYEHKDQVTQALDALFPYLQPDQ